MTLPDTLKRREAEFRNFYARNFVIQVILNLAAGIFASTTDQVTAGSGQFIIAGWAFFVTPAIGFYGTPSTSIPIGLVQSAFAFFGFFFLILRTKLLFTCNGNVHCAGGNELLFNLWYGFTVGATLHHWVMALRAWTFHNESRYSYEKQKKR